jgi:hypothetical protein
VWSILPVINLNSSLKENILIVASGRSGTTWLQELINKNNSYGIIFEPFNRRRVSVLSSFEDRTFISGTKSSLDTKKGIIEDIFSGKVLNSWTKSHNKKIVVKKWIIKCIRLNLSIKWICDTFPNLTVVFLIRNPYDVAKSRIKLDWGCDLSTFKRQQELLNGPLAEFRDLLNDNTLSIFEKNILYWCIEHYVPLSQLKKGDCTIVFYENMKKSPVEVLNNLGFFRKSLTNVVSKPSRTTSFRKTNFDTKFDYGKSEEILCRFKLHKIYKNQLNPSLISTPFAHLNEA